jgi:hypothetical protein
MVDHRLWPESQGTNYARRLIERARRLVVQECLGPEGSRPSDPDRACWTWRVSELQSAGAADALRSREGDV